MLPNHDWGEPRHASPWVSTSPTLPIRNHLLMLVSRLALGGEERFNLTLVQQLVQHNLDVTVCATSAGPHPWQAEFARHTPNVFVLPDLFEPEGYAPFLVDHIRAHHISTVLVVSSLLGYGLLPYLHTHCPNVAFVDYIHMVDLRWRDGGYARVSANARRWLDLTITSSVDTREWMVTQGVEAARVEICSTNIDPHVWDPARYDRAALRRALSLQEDQPVILYAARLEAQKRPALLLEILGRLRQRGLAFTCLIAGDGPQRPWLLRQAARHGLSNSVRWLGAVEPHKMPEMMAVSDIFCLPSAYEGIALTLYEAMAMALPVVAAEVGGQRELVLPEAGFLVPPGVDEAQVYVDLIAALMASPTRRRTLGQAARERIVGHFSIENMTSRMVALFAHAQIRARQAPRPMLSLAEAERVMQQMNDLHRQGAVFDHLFVGPPESVERLTVLRRMARWLKNRWLRPLYFWGLEHGLEWLVPAKLMYRRAIHPSAHRD